MDDSPAAVARRLTGYVDALLACREERDAAGIRGRTQLVLRALEKLRAAHVKSPLPAELVRQIQRDKERAQLDLPATSAEYQNICWDCFAHGKEVIVDKRVDPVCKTCGWVQCVRCGACRDPKFGECPDRVYKGRRGRAER